MSTIEQHAYTMKIASVCARCVAIDCLGGHLTPSADGITFAADLAAMLSFAFTHTHKPLSPENMAFMIKEAVLSIDTFASYHRHTTHNLVNDPVKLATLVDEAIRVAEMEL